MLISIWVSDLVKWGKNILETKCNGSILILFFNIYFDCFYVEGALYSLQINRTSDLFKTQIGRGVDCSTPVSIAEIISCTSCKDLNIKTDISADGNQNYAKINPTAGAYVEFYSGGAYRGRVNIK
jgi:hypothetical protein